MPKKSYDLFAGDSCLASLNDPYFVITARLLRQEHISLETAQLYTELICKHYKLNVISIYYSGKLSKSYGMYKYSWKHYEIVVSALGETVSTVLHELAHYVAHRLDNSPKHTKEFAKRFKEIYILWEKYLKD